MPSGSPEALDAVEEAEVEDSSGGKKDGGKKAEQAKLQSTAAVGKAAGKDKGMGKTSSKKRH